MKKILFYFALVFVSTQLAHANDLTQSFSCLVDVCADENDNPEECEEYVRYHETIRVPAFKITKKSDQPILFCESFGGTHVDTGERGASRFECRHPLSQQDSTEFFRARANASREAAAYFSELLNRELHEASCFPHN